MRVAAISVDLDGLERYREIHGLPSLETSVTDAVYALTLGRISEFARTLGVPMTLFAIGEDLEHGDRAAQLRDEVRRSDGTLVVENHSYRHHYDLSRRSRAYIRDDIQRAQVSLEHVTGRAPQGFRAPGYLMSPPVLDAIEDVGLRFDSSVLSSWPYLAAKALVVAGQRAIGRSSAAVLDRLSVMSAPTSPYRPGDSPYERGLRAVVELPIAVTPFLRVPVIGTSVVAAPSMVGRAMIGQLVAAPVFNLELHGIDFLGAEDLAMRELRWIQPDAHLRLSTKLRRLSSAVDVLRSQRRRFMQLYEVAATVDSGL